MNSEAIVVSSTPAAPATNWFSQTLLGRGFRWLSDKVAGIKRVTANTVATARNWVVRQWLALQAKVAAAAITAWRWTAPARKWLSATANNVANIVWPVLREIAAFVVAVAIAYATIVFPLQVMALCAVMAMAVLKELFVALRHRAAQYA